MLAFASVAEKHVRFAKRDVQRDIPPQRLRGRVLYVKAATLRASQKERRSVRRLLFVRKKWLCKARQARSSPTLCWVLGRTRYISSLHAAFSIAGYELVILCAILAIQSIAFLLTNFEAVMAAPFESIARKCRMLHRTSTGPNSPLSKSLDKRAQNSRRCL